MNSENTYSTFFSKFSLVEEAYTILQSAFSDMLENPLSQFQLQPVDYMDLIKEKLAISKELNSIDTEELDELRKVENDLNSLIIKYFNKSHIADLELYDGNKNYLIQTIYNVFFFNKISYINKFIKNYFSVNINLFKEMYSKDKKDLIISQFKQELSLKDSSLYILAVEYEEITKTILTADNISIGELFEYCELESEELIMLLSIFEHSNQYEEYNKFMNGFVDSHTFYEFLPNIRNSIFEVLKTR